MRDLWPFNDVWTSLWTNKQSSSSSARPRQAQEREWSWELSSRMRTRFCPGSFDDMAFQWRWLLMRLFGLSANNNAFKTTIAQWASNSHEPGSNPCFGPGPTKRLGSGGWEICAKCWWVELSVRERLIICMDNKSLVIFWDLSQLGSYIIFFILIFNFGLPFALLLNLLN